MLDSHDEDFDATVMGMGLGAQPIIPWIGGKRRLVAEILPRFEPRGASC